MTMSYIVHNNFANFMTRIPKVIFFIRKIEVNLVSILAPTLYLHKAPAHLRPSK